ncbi:MAG TPA: carboxy terminal-processing peptidase [Polyangiales bacterium]|nr:carboxy terminal-processing peptidase [Polyangiales bacterium]
MNRLNRLAAYWATLGVAIVLAVNCAGRTALAAPPGVTEANITRLTTDILEHSQFSHHVLDREFAGKLLDNYLDALDGSHELFLKSDLDEFAAYRATLAQATRSSGDTTAARAIFHRYLEHVVQRSAFVAETLKTAKFDFTGHEMFALDREHAERPVDINAAHALWSAQLRAEYLQEKLGQEKLGDAQPAQIASKLTRRYAQQLETVKALSEDEVLEVYLNALAHVYDPHSDYLGHEQMESFSIAMKLSLFGIGAALESSDGFCTIREILPGSPAAKSGALMPGDRIVAVGQASKEPVDVVNMPLTRTVELIRGPKGTTVTLKIVAAGTPDGSPPKTVRLVRDEIKLEDQEAKARIIDLTHGEGATLRLGVIDVPGFYADMSEHGEGEQRSVTNDVALLLNKLKKEKTQGIVLDLRRNGGGSLKEAISLTGLFIKKGPVVQTRRPAGAVDVESDPDSAVLYDGPLIVLTSRFSASASEILAGALQDYGRAIIVGDSQTFGKGTVQSILPLARMMDEGGLAHAYDPGALKITVSKFYRPGGASTQLRGVAADVVVPSTTDFDDVSESSLKNPLPWDTVPPAPYERLNRVAAYLPALREQSAKRITTQKKFAELAEDVVRLKKSIASKTVSLNEAERRQEIADNKARRSEREKETAALQASQPVTYDVTLKNASAPGLTRSEPKKDKAKRAHTAAATPDAANDEPSVQGFADDIILNEGVQILADYSDLLHAPKVATTAPPTH